MHIPRIYQDVPLVSGEVIQLDSKATNHLVRVLRFKVGDLLHVFNGSSKAYEATLAAVEKKFASVLIGAELPHETESPLHVHLIQGIARGDKMDYVIQKATELGVQAITPLITEYCDVRLDEQRFKKRLQHWQGVAIAASEQCGRSQIVTIHPPINLAQWAEQQHAPLAIALHPYGESTLNSLPKNVATADVLIGPEGGFSPLEINLLQQCGVLCVRLGPRILRTETAGIAVISLLQYLWGDFK